ncbi:MAG: ParB/RepB/Spo0J family partition protein, partial [Parasporobacterium sp.]|nr:ParB/RepB/Spo0J family partition protein [Parasporobacterium sp.]
LIENIQRENLNPVEEALAYKRLTEEYDLTQEELSERISKSRTAIANTMRLLKLHTDVQQMLVDGTLTAGHARALLAIEDQELQTEAAQRILSEGLNVRQTEDLVKQLSLPVKEKKPAAKIKNSIFYKDLEKSMTESIGAKVKIHQKEEGRGKIEISYFSEDELDRIYTALNSLRQL